MLFDQLRRVWRFAKTACPVFSSALHKTILLKLWHTRGVGRLDRWPEPPALPHSCPSRMPLGGSAGNAISCSLQLVVWYGHAETIVSHHMATCPRWEPYRGAEVKMACKWLATLLVACFQLCDSRSSDEMGACFHVFSLPFRPLQHDGTVGCATLRWPGAS